MNTETARKLLTLAEVFFDTDDEDSKLSQTLNMNDTWAWACSDGEYVPDEELPEVAGLFVRYGWAGILYWVSERRDSLTSEFEDNNRLIEFVRNEERLRNTLNHSELAYKKITYTIGE